MSRSDDLSHVPRRGVAYAKELRRMGLEVVPAGGHARRDDDMSSNDVKQVSEVARDIADLGKRAREVKDHLRRNIDDANEALGLTEEVSRALSGAVADLRGALGVQTNFPPGEGSARSTTGGSAAEEGAGGDETDNG